ncbi:MAG TPA: FHA domain-containing protein [Trebonia sp.]|nr:FHA domain-containing protein [Trebonia sp.]
MAVCPDGHQSGSDDFCDVCGLRITSMSQAQPAGDPWGSPSRGPAAAGTAGTAAAPAGPGARGLGGDTIADPSCPQCGTSRTGRFCEGCGLDYTTGRLPDGSLVGAVSPPVAPAQSAGPPTTPYSSTIYPQPAAPPPPPSRAPAPPAPAAASPWDAQAPAAAAPPIARSPALSPDAATWSVLVSADRGYYDKVRAASGPDAESISFPAYCPERQFTLSGAEMRIGRHSTSRGIYPEIDLTGPPTDPGISRLHAVLIAGPAGWSVLDPGSANGTQVNGTDIPQGEQVPLREGDRVNLGAWTVLTVRRP